MFTPIWRSIGCCLARYKKLSAARSGKDNSVVRHQSLLKHALETLAVS